MTHDRAADFADVFQHFAVGEEGRPERSFYPYAPVFPVRLNGAKAVIKRTTGPVSAAAAIARWVEALAGEDVGVVTPLPLRVDNPAQVGDRVWVAYPWVDGRPYTGSPDDVAAAGDLLGRIHAARPAGDGMPEFGWPDHDAASVEEDVTGLRRVLGEHAPDLRDEVTARFEPWLESFMAQTLPPVRDGGLPRAAVSMDYKAGNLVYVDGAPVLIDPDNAEYAPRILDLALAALLFHNEMATAPPRLFTGGEWSAFSSAYRRHVRLTEAELALWPVAVRYMLLEWGVWTLIDAAEWNDWDDPRKRGFLRDLATVDPGRFPLR
ncbi:phosphotransferase enzyme family protein [Nonomuraea sp. KM88]|uniref:phosphotransferase enzyme family protein n=1 Tax=Nonomuraea sp. KM88 TaxID=3457427 RepID=UPI003FCE6225